MAVVRLDRAARVLEANHAALELLGDPDPSGRRFTDFLRKGDRGAVERLLAGKRSSPQPVRATFARADGSVVVADLVARVGEDGSCVIAAWDMTAHVAALERVSRQEVICRALFERARDALFVLDAGSGMIVDVNAAACELFAASRGELLGRHRMALFPPESALVYEAAFADHVSRSNAVPVSVRLTRVDGSVVEGEMSAVVVDATGLVVLQVVFRGIVQRLREAEERARLAARTRERQKLESVAVLAGGVAHEMNNILAGILLTGTVLMRSLPEGTAQKDAASIVAAVRRGKGLTRNLLGFAQRGMYRKDVVPVNRLLTEVSLLLRRTLPPRIRLVTELQSRRAFKGDPDQIAEAVMNGCHNAVESMAGDGVLTLASSDVDLTDDDLTGLPELCTGAFARIEIRDTGHGMYQETLGRAFDPFYTTKGIGESAGLGLSMVFGVVRHHLGRAELRSRVGEGTTLTIDLPEALEPPIAAPEGGHASNADRNGAVLVVDDDDWVRFSSRRMLESLGRRVLEAADGVEGLEMYRRHAAEIAFVLLDLRMPRMDGAETLRRLVQVAPGARVILCTGFDREQVSQDLFALGHVGFLRKPFEVSELLQQLERLWPSRAPEAV
ncbi:MAG: response regulator [Myxococcota bacterium]